MDDQVVARLRRYAKDGVVTPRTIVRLLNAGELTVEQLTQVAAELGSHGLRVEGLHAQTEQRHGPTVGMWADPVSSRTRDPEAASKSAASIPTSGALVGVATSRTRIGPNAPDGEPSPQLRVAGATADPVKDYLRQIGKVPLLNATQEVELAKRIEAGLVAERRLGSRDRIRGAFYDELIWLQGDGQVAKGLLITANLRLVVSLAKKYTGRGMPFMDLIQEGNLGLIRGVEKFDFTLGYKFSTYATWWIRQAITRGLADHARLIRVPVYMVERIAKVDSVRRGLAAQGVTPGISRVADACELTAEQVLECLKLGPVGLPSLDQPMGDDGLTTLGDLLDKGNPTLSAEHMVEQAEMKEAIQGVLDTLSEREAGIISMRTGLADGEPKTLDEIGRVYLVTRERIRQIEKKALEKLRQPHRSQVLRPYA